MRVVHRLSPLAIGIWIACAIILTATSAPLESPEHKSPAQDETTACVLIALPTDMFTRVDPPEEFLRSRLAGEPLEGLVAITVNYNGTWPTAARDAFQYAVDIWKSQLTSTVPIVVDAEFKDLGPNVLGSAGAKYTVRDFSGATVANTWPSLPR